MFDWTQSEFPAIENDWKLAMDAMLRAEAGVAEALARFRSSGDDTLLVPALAVRQSAKDRFRALIHSVWSNPI